MTKILLDLTLPISGMSCASVGGISLTLFVSMVAARVTPKAKVNDALIELPRALSDGSS